MSYAIWLSGFQRIGPMHANYNLSPGPRLNLLLLLVTNLDHPITFCTTLNQKPIVWNWRYFCISSIFSHFIKQSSIDDPAFEKVTTSDMKNRPQNCELLLPAVVNLSGCIRKYKRTICKSLSGSELGTVGARVCCSTTRAHITTLPAEKIKSRKHEYFECCWILTTVV